MRAATRTHTHGDTRVLCLIPAVNPHLVLEATDLNFISKLTVCTSATIAHKYLCIRVISQCTPVHRGNCTFIAGLVHSGCVTPQRQPSLRHLRHNSDAAPVASLNDATRDAVSVNLALLSDNDLCKRTQENSNLKNFQTPCVSQKCLQTAETSVSMVSSETQKEMLFSLCFQCKCQGWKTHVRFDALARSRSK